MTQPLIAHLAARIDVNKPHEVSFPVCQAYDGELYAGQVMEGTPVRVPLSTDCGANGRAVAVAHTHLEAIGAMALPSKQDVNAARQLGINKTCIIQPESRRVICYDVS